MADSGQTTDQHDDEGIMLFIKNYCTAYLPESAAYDPEAEPSRDYLMKLGSHMKSIVLSD